MQRPYSPQYGPSPRRRRSQDVFHFQKLPKELQFLIIELSLPQVNDVSRHWPAPIPALLRTSRQFHADTRMTMKKWSPIHYIPDPTHFESVPYPGPVRVETICLSMFHNARLGVLRSGTHTQTVPDDHHDLVQDWLDNVPRLPQFETLQTITIDATPAPGWVRYDKPSWLPILVNDKSVSDRFIYEHIGPITELIANIAAFYQSVHHDPITVDLAGIYGQRSRAFPDYVSQRCERNSLTVPFVGTIVPDPPPPYHQSGPPMTIPNAISELYSPRSIPQERYDRYQSHYANDKRRLLSYIYTPTSDFLFQNCFADDPTWTMHQLEKLTDFVLDDEYDRPRRHVDVHISDFARGSLVCSLAKDLDLVTTPRSSWRRKEIRVSRGLRRWNPGTNRTRSTGTQSTESLMSFLLMSAAVVMFVGILSSDMRRRRG